MRTKTTVTMGRGSLQPKHVPFQWGTVMQSASPRRFCHVSKFHASDCLHRNAVKSLPTPWLWQSIHYFPEALLQRPPNSPLPVENVTYFWRGHGQKYRSECTKTRHFKSKIHFFLERGPVPLTRPLFRWGLLPKPHLSPLPKILDPPLHPQYSILIYATGPDRFSSHHRRTNYSPLIKNALLF